MQMERLVGRAGMTVALYVLQRPTRPAESGKEVLAAKAMLADAAAKAEVHLRCQKSDSAAVETWFSAHCEQSWHGFQTKNPAAAGLNKDALISEARGLIDRNWQNVVTLASAYAAQSVDVVNREFEFLDKFYCEPDETL
jgi:hypothetical protein